MKSSGICLISGRTSGSVARQFVGCSLEGVWGVGRVVAAAASCDTDA